ncbi:ComF family protein [Streptomyces sp. NBC_01381]|uniref:ComF family protein n=1 Tax=Streptomyces sp. NBC_01381 TaxID=2903845 RepID=UPI00225594C3|nr:phosphoribosyltransferase family protein [Streptomyces sp. NBC_01381]MCX4666551.1 ComF family protein [Streptomyces sp. NBC_01381]
MRPLAEHHCAVCSQSLDAPDATCRNKICRWSPERRCFTRVDALALFAHPLEQPIKRFKYDGRKGWSKVFGRLIVGWLEEHRRQVADIDLIIGNPTAPDRVPLQHIETIMESAYTEDTLDQWPIADPDSPVLTKKYETKKSASGGAQWADKLQAAEEHAKALRFHRSVEGKRILLIDDVFTTGATFHTVGKRLIAEGKATEVRGLVLARVPFGS